MNGFVGQGAALRQLWNDRMTVTRFREVEKPNGTTGFVEEILYSDIPCKLSFSTLQAVVQVVKIFCDPEILIEAGSQISVSHHGRIFTFEKTGDPAVFHAHQEIILVPAGRKG